jgi:O-acetyl-ADP-ribose deacetylase (regulator of RNase III)
MSDYPIIPYPFYEHTVELRQQDIIATGAAVIVNSISVKANFGGYVAQAILPAAGDEIRDMVQNYERLPGGVVITHAGKLMGTTPTRHIFHTVVTNIYRASPELIIRAATRCIQLADLLDQKSIAVPALGSGVGRARTPQVVKHILNQIIEVMPGCKSLERVIIATKSPRTFNLFNARALVSLALTRREQELMAALPSIPPSLYGLVGQMLERIKAASQADDQAQVDELYEQAHGPVFLGKELQSKL